MGKMTYLEYKERLEFNDEQIAELFKYANEIGIEFLHLYGIFHQ